MVTVGLINALEIELEDGAALGAPVELVGISHSYPDGVMRIDGIACEIAMLIFGKAIAKFKFVPCAMRQYCAPTPISRPPLDRLSLNSHPIACFSTITKNPHSYLYPTSNST